MLFFIFRSIILLVFLITAASSYGNSVMYKCTYNAGNEIEYIGTSGLLKTIKATKYSDNLKYTFFIKNVDDFNEIEDYVVVENVKQEKITYFLTCNK